MQDDPDHRQRMHFMGPPGYAPCTREWPHEGPCAHKELKKPILGKVGNWIALDWCDGPIMEIARVRFNDGKDLVQVKSFGWPDRDEPDKINVRFGRDDLLKMLDLLEGKPVKNWRDEDETG